MSSFDSSCCGSSSDECSYTDPEEQRMRDRAYNFIILDSSWITVVGKDRATGGGQDCSKPAHVLPTVIGFGTSPGDRSRGTKYIGHEAIASKGMADLKYPIQNGRIVDKDSLHTLWSIAIARMKYQRGNPLNPYCHPFLLVDLPGNTEADRDEMARIVFDRFRSPKLCIQPSGVLVSHALDLPNCAVIDMGLDGLQVTVVRDRTMASHSYHSITAGDLPGMAGSILGGIHSSVTQIVITGVGAKLKGVLPAFQSVMAAKGPSFRLHAPTDGDITAWRGAKVFCGKISLRNSLTVTREDYLEQGVEALRNKGM